MKDDNKTTEELLEEVARLRRRIARYNELVSKRHQSELQHGKSAETLRNILESSPEAILVIDLDGNITDCSRSAVELYGFSSREELRGKNSYGFIAPGFDAADVQDMVRALATGWGTAKEYVCLARSGRAFPLEVSARAVQDPLEELRGYVVIARDVSRRRAAEERLQREKEYFRTIVETAMDGIVIVNSRGDIVDFNEAFVKMVGYTRPELRLVTYQDLTPVEFASADERALQQALQGGKYEEYEKECLRKDGSRFAVIASGGILGGKVTGADWNLVTYLKDISVRRRSASMLGDLRSRRAQVAPAPRTPEERWLSLDDVADHLGIKRDTVYKWIRHKNLPGHKMGRLWKFRVSEVEEWLASQGAE